MGETGSQSMDRLEWICRHPDRAASVVEEYRSRFAGVIRQGCSAVIGSMPKEGDDVAGDKLEHQAILSGVRAACLGMVNELDWEYRKLASSYVARFLADTPARQVRLTHMIPLWLSALNPEIGQERVLDLLVANTWFFEAFRIQDICLDEPDSSSPEWIILHGLFLRWAMERYRRHVPPEHFWSDFNRYDQEMSNAILWERRLVWGRTASFGPDEWTLSGNKAALIKLAGSSVLSLVGQRNKLPDLEAFLRAHLVVRQVADDLVDFEEDLKARVVSGPIARLQELVVTQEPAAVTDARLLYLTFCLLPVCSELLSMSSQVTIHGLRALASWPETGFHRLSRARLKETDQFQATLAEVQHEMWRELGWS